MTYDVVHIAGKPHFLVPVHEFAKLTQKTGADLPSSVLQEIALNPGKAIRIIRTFRGLNQEGLAAAAGISRPYLTEIETGRKDGSIRALKSIAAALNVPLDILA